MTDWMTLMLVTFLCWWQNHYVGDFLNEELGHQHPESVTNILNLSRTHMDSNIRHQHRRNRQIALLLKVFLQVLWLKMGFLSFQLNFSYLWPARIFYFLIIIHIARLTFEKILNSIFQFSSRIIKKFGSKLKSDLAFRHPEMRHLSFHQFAVHQNASKPNQQS